MLSNDYYSCFIEAANCYHYYHSCFSESAYETEFQHLLRGREGIVGDMHLPEVKGLKPPQAEAMMRLTKLPAFKALAKGVQNNPVRVDLCQINKCVRTNQ